MDCPTSNFLCRHVSLFTPHSECLMVFIASLLVNIALFPHFVTLSTSDMSKTTVQRLPTQSLGSRFGQAMSGLSRFIPYTQHIQVHFCKMVTKCFEKEIRTLFPDSGAIIADIFQMNACNLCVAV